MRIAHRLFRWTPLPGRLSPERIAAVALLVVAGVPGCRRGPVDGPGSTTRPGVASVDRLAIAPGALRGWNILLVSFDTLRADHVGCYGNEDIETPVMDGLAREGVRFTQAIAPASSTLPSHASLLTGLEPQHHGARANAVFQLDAGVSTLAELLAAAGYRTAAFVSTVVLDRRYGLRRGFDHYGDQWQRLQIGKTATNMERPGADTNQVALAWLEANADEKFFLFLHYFDPHFPYEAPAPFSTQFAPYDAEIAYADQQLGVVLDGLDRRGLRSKTLVVVAADHGEGLGEHGELGHGMALYDSTIHVPLIVSGPPPVPQGRTVTRLVGLIDVAPTILAAIGQQIPAEMDGLSLLEGPGSKPRAIHIETLAGKCYHPKWVPPVGIRRTDYKFIFLPEPELYDLRADPKELSNIYASRPEVAGELYDLLRQRVADDPSLVATVQTNLALTPEVCRQLRSLGYITADAGPTSDQRGREDDHKLNLWDARQLLPRANALSLARECLRRGRAGEAIRILKPHIEHSLSSGHLLLALGLAYEGNGQRREAQSCFERILEAKGLSPSLVAAVGGAYLDCGLVEKGIACLQEALQIDAEDPAALCQLGQAYRRQGDDKKAFAAFHRLARVWHGCYAALAYYEIGRTYESRDRLDRAVKALETAIELAPSFEKAAKELQAVRVMQAARTRAGTPAESS